MSPTIRKAAAGAAAVLIAALIAGKYVMLLEPAVAREKRAACRGLRPSPTNKALLTGEFTSFPRPAPDLMVQDYTGQMRKLSEYKGQVVFLNFWATWCPPCIDEVPAIENLQREFNDEDFVVVALASSNDWNEVRSFFPDGTNMTIMLDPPANDEDRLGTIAKSWGVPALPETFLIDKDGFVRYYFANKRDWHSDVALTCVRSLIEEE